MTTMTRFGWWMAALVAGGLLLWLLQGALAPFLAGAAIAYFLDPLVDRLETWGVRRSLGALGVIVLAVGAAVALFLLLVPVLVSQAVGLANEVPALVERAREYLAGLATHELGQWIDLSPGGQFEDSLLSAGGRAGASALQAALAGGIAILDAIAFAVVVPVVGYYLLADWDRAIAHVNRLIPRGAAPTAQRLAGEIDRVLAAFLRGQVLVCVLLAAFYAIALSATGLKYGATIGIVAGAASFIPYVGTAIGFGLSGSVALAQFLPDWPPVALVLGIFILGQIVESYVLTPRLVGRSVGLHPAWLLFALFAGGNLLGFAGLLVAIPVAAAIGVLARFADERYREGRFYRGTGSSKDDAGPASE